MPYGLLYDMTFSTIDERRKNPDARYDLIAHWFKAHEEHPERLSMRNIEAHTFQAVGAGSDTVSTALQSFVYHIIRSPEGNHWQRIRDEIVSFLLILGWPRLATNTENVASCAARRKMQ
jgi:cytochrome P450